MPMIKIALLEGIENQLKEINEKSKEQENLASKVRDLLVIARNQLNPSDKTICYMLDTAYLGLHKDVASHPELAEFAAEFDGVQEAQENLQKYANQYGAMINTLKAAAGGLSHQQKSILEAHEEGNAAAQEYANTTVDSLRVPELVYDEDLNFSDDELPEEPGPKESVGLPVDSEEPEEDQENEFAPRPPE